MARAATDYTRIIQMKEKEIAALVSDLRSSKVEGERSLKHNTELKTRIETLTAELVAQRGDQKRHINAQTKLREELDELRALMEAKTSEESRWNEAEKSKEEELAELRRQVVKLQEELGDARRLGLEGQRKLKVDLDNTRRDHQSLLQSHASLSDKERACQSKLLTAQASLNEVEKSKRALESEAQALRSRQHDNESQLAEARRAKEASDHSFHVLILVCSP
jgi:myosin heavy chain 9/10/11/14